MGTDTTNQIGYITVGRGISIHRRDCPNVLNLPDLPERRIMIDWDDDGSQRFMVRIVMEGTDRHGLFADIARSISDTGTNIQSADIHATEGGMTGQFVIEVENLGHLKKVIVAAEMLEVPIVGSFVGRDKDKTIEDNLEEFAKVWPPIVKYAADHNVKIAIENCPMIFSKDEWPSGHNVAYMANNTRRTIPIDRVIERRVVVQVIGVPQHLHEQCLGVFRCCRGAIQMDLLVTEIGA